VDVTDALDRIGDIHSHLAKAEEYRGYRPAALAASGLLGLLAALAQPWLSAQDDPSAFLRYWIVAGLACAAVAGSATAIGYVRQEDEFARRRSRTVMRQFVPCLLAGIAVTVALGRPDRLASSVILLPGLWTLLFGLGTVASVPYLPRLAAAVAAWYLLAGWLLLSFLEGPVPSGWSVGLPFGIGQLLAAGVLYSARRSEVET
jgi:hypothetical protein